ncbi:class I SAM-dependent methyltransferase [Streptomyces luteolifulvus]|uniref:class I SAM-dependent methyltransferase n=1 Tax=Streptomyces luteolifulvus TaxID=2615112 RepID=UPI00177CEAF6|nr:class I SAM-dependent methyltransferase [Streptomyces luteolifulvus]
MGPVASVVGGYLAMHTLGTGIRRYTPPTVMDFTRSGGALATSAAAFLENLGWPAAEVEEVLHEYREVSELLVRRYAEIELFYPRTHGVEAETSAVLYGLNRLLKPQSVVETGVADGRSSWLILAALERNGQGRLHSFDINRTAGRLVGQHPQWRLEILDRKEPEASLAHALQRVGPIDLFFHDSDHLYLPQLFEYSQVWPRMTEGGVFASDDVNCSRAFLDFCQERGQRPRFLFDSRKITGAVRLPGARSVQQGQLVG